MLHLPPVRWCNQGSCLRLSYDSILHQLISQIQSLQVQDLGPLAGETDSPVVSLLKSPLGMIVVC